MPTQTISRCGGTSGGAALLEVLIAANVKALYKLDELSGTTAVDSSGNGYDATTYTTRSAPAWGEAAGPPGTTTAYFTQAGGPVGLRNAAFPALAADWTILGWFKQDGDTFALAASQGQAISFAAQGFAIGINSTLEVGPRKAWVDVGNGVGITSQVLGDNALPHSVWYMLAATRSGTTVSLYVNGAAQTSTATPAYSAATGTWLGNNGDGFGMKGWCSWIGYFDSALTAAQIGAVYTAASI